MSVKSVPGCLVLIAPSAIGVPVALTPGFGPHVDVLTAALELDELAAGAELLLALALALALLLLLLPHPASARSAPTAIAATPIRTRGTTWKMLTAGLLSSWWLATRRVSNPEQGR